MIALEPYIPLAWWLTLALAAAAMLAAYAWLGRRRLPQGRWLAIVSLMCIAVAVPLVLLLNPTWIERLPPPAGKPRLTVLLDRSASMNVADAEKGQTRFASASQVATTVADSLKDRFDVQVATFADTSAAAASGLTGIVPNGSATNIAGAIDDALQDRPEGQAILLLSDGADNADDGPRRILAAADKARAMAVPIFTRTIGGAGSVSDIDLAVDAPQELAFVAQQVPVTVRIKQRGGRAAETKLTLSIDDKTVERRVVRLAANGDATATFQVTQDRPGLFRYRFQAEPFAGEDTPLNNQATLLLRVIDEPLRILLLEGKPYWDTKFLIRTLAADPSIELVSMVRLTEGRVLERTITRGKAPAAAGAATSTPMPPAAEAKPIPTGAVVSDHWRIHPNARNVLADPSTLAKYQIVVLGRESDLYLTDDTVGQLKKWLLDRDGSLICFRGPPAAQIGRRLGELMPLKWSATREQRFRVKLTDRGNALKWLPAAEGSDTASLAALPSLVSVNNVEQTMPLTEVFAQGVGAGDADARPVIAYQPVGNGRVVVIEGAGMWRWAFLPPEFQGQDNVYGTLWRSLMRWLVSQVSLLPNQQVALRSEKVSYSAGEPIVLTLLTRDEQANAKAPEVELLVEGQPEWKRFSAVPSPQSPGQFRVALGRLSEGEYRAKVVGAAATESAAATAFDVRGNLAERLDVAARPDLMKLLAERTGGAAEAVDPAELAKRLNQHLAATRPESSIRLTAWDRWWVLAGALGIWAMAWGVRRASGLV